MSNKTRVMVVDGQGGGLGKAVIERLLKEKMRLHILAIGTNSIATSMMLKAGADEVATGENAVVYNAGSADVIIGGIGIISANAMLGEITPAMANAIASGPSVKLLIPSSKCNLLVVGAEEMTLSQRLEGTVRLLREILQKDE